MPDSVRATIYLDSQLLRALKLKAAETDETVSALVNAAVRDALAEDADDLAAIAARRREPTRSFEAFAAELRRRGKV